ncbi:DUF2207 domain-containing protein [Campylobacter upsaliensis]|uniref:2-amino-4-hydroxy-6- hydroxymethyldihydropteridine pyrophosphokinase n=1 Tax=Campylobacter upsaliensis TaxID=28080 RepID=UPI00128AC0E5|nr:2-amino-4-hydroxy-6-hydroxymethyldihydropteridine pyrophosphokinase [Campylobacter upsaliensis]EAI0016255.1 2-amino-4-hydroxy-6-hydroxymethyldihydropteridine pyrophosphokinase [Campylobacter upsaliensis]EAI6210039.1 DUF2207 domain-containing protein [Campylobacter upsaliensis]EAI6218434.1 DUF2207 domain-containing protein [Campylobacter upsaliensis]EAI8237120.1 DUF2207 domain-containing protein [Campylobacter upsaliensis]EAI8428823.1 DUF2207 domain-containing protein [Campylobacter upsalien
MKGKILAVGLISGEDGNRYTFEASDVSNLEGRSMENLTGCEVDFEVSGDMAKNIFITGRSINMANIQGQLMANDTQGIRFKFLLAIGIYFIGSIISLIPIVGWILGPILFIGAFVLFVMAVLGTKQASESKTLLKNFILSLIIAFIAGIVAMIFGFIFGFSNSFGIVVAIIIACAGGIATFVYHLLFFRELAFITGQKFLLWAVYLNVLGGLTAIIFIGWLILFGALALFILGFYKMQEIRKRTEADIMPWF